MFKNKSLLQTTSNALNGLKILFSEKAAKRGTLLLTLTGFLFFISVNFYTVLIFTLSWGILALEAINTAIEMLSDIYTHTYDERIKKIKDLASASVLLMVLAQICISAIWIVIIFK